MKTRLLLLVAFLTVAVTSIAIVPSFIASPPDNNAPASQPVPAAPPVASVDTNAVQKQRVVPPRIVLYGTFINQQTELALIGTDGQEENWLGRKQPLNADFYLDEIFKDHVIVRDTGNTVTLEIRINNGGATQELPDVVPATPAHAWVESLPPVPGIDRLETNRYRIKRELLMKELQSGEIFKQVLITPEEEGGFSINRIKEGSMAEVIGLRVGDTIHKINDKPLTNITDVLDLYKNLDSLENVDVDISRMHEMQQLHYELN